MKERMFMSTEDLRRIEVLTAVKEGRVLIPFIKNNFDKWYGAVLSILR